LAEILVYIGTRREMQDKSVPVGSPIGQNEPIGVEEQLASSHWLSHTTERTIGGENRITSMALKRASCVGLRKDKGLVVKVWWAEN
jgi:hypothetical protein